MGVIALAASLFNAPPAMAAPQAAVTFVVSPTQIRVGEAPYVSGTATYGGRPAAGARIRIQYKLGTTWRDVTTRTADSRGFFKANVYREKGTTLRAYVVASSKWSAGTSDPVAITITDEPQTLEQKAEQYAGLLRDPMSDVSTGTTQSGNPVRWQRFRGGYVMEVGAESGNLRAFYVPAEFGDLYRSVSGAEGSLGPPRADPECALLDAGCIQRFEHGVIYRNNASSTKLKGPRITMGTSLSDEIFAAARTQAGYVEPAFRINKFTTWSGHRVAWCAMFWSWSATAVGQAAAVPQARNFEEFKTMARNRGVHKGTPPEGAIVFLAFNGAASSTHSGMVVSVGSTTIRTLEGNVTQADGSRMVKYYTRPLSMVRGWYMPGE